MKKRFDKVIIFVLCILLLTACGGTGAPAKEDPSVRDDAGADGNAAAAVTEAETTVRDRELTLQFSFGEKTGRYTGALGADGLPTGKGTFISKNADGAEWTYEGEFEHGHFQGEGRTVWEDGDFERGTYVNDVVQPIDDSLLPEVYETPDEYAGYTVVLSGRVYNIIDEVGLQMIRDVRSGDNDTIVVCNASNIRVGDTVKVTGRVLGTYHYQNTELTALLLVATNVEPAEQQAPGGAQIRPGGDI